MDTHWGGGGLPEMGMPGRWGEVSVREKGDICKTLHNEF